jgi:hypothetical protein
VIRRDSYHFTNDADDEYTNLLPLCFLLFLFIYSSLSISFSFLHYLTIHQTAESVIAETHAHYNALKAGNVDKGKLWIA